MSEMAVVDRQWELFAAHPDACDDVVPPVDQGAPALSVGERLRELGETVSVVAARVRAGAGVASDAELVGWLRGLVAITDRVPSVVQAVVAELDRRRVCEGFGYSSTALILTGELRLRPSAAKTTVTVAQAVGERAAFTGEILPPLREHVAGAQADGSISADHAAVIVHALGRVPAGADPAAVEHVETTLVQLAQRVSCARSVLPRAAADRPVDASLNRMLHDIPLRITEGDVSQWRGCSSTAG